MKLRPIVRRMLRMCPAAWYIFIRSVQLSAFLLLCAFVLLMECDGGIYDHYRLYMSAVALSEITQAILLIAVIASVCIEDVNCQQG